MPGLAKVARQMLFRSSSAVCEADVVTIGDFVSASHCEMYVSASVQLPMAMLRRSCKIMQSVAIDDQFNLLLNAPVKRRV